MSRRSFIAMLKLKIGKLNRKIDLLIVEGKPYKAEALKHQALTLALRKHA